MKVYKSSLLALAADALYLASIAAETVSILLDEASTALTHKATA